MTIPLAPRRVARSESWRRDFVRANNAHCHYCNRTGSLDVGPDDRPWHVDHKDPIARGGSDEEGNLALACKRCNLTKSAQPYKWFAPFARAAFWVYDEDWRASEAEIDALMSGYKDVQDRYGDNVWRVDIENYKIVRIGADGVGILESIVSYGDRGTSAEQVDRSDRGDAMSVLGLIESMYRLLPAMVAEIRMLRAEQTSEVAP